MELQDIKARLHPAESAEIDVLYTKYLSVQPEDGIDGFARWLYERGKITDRVFRELHACGRPILTQVETLGGATYFPDEDTVEETEEFPPDDDTEEGNAPRFQFLGRLSEGAMGVIHIVRERQLQRKVALKQMHPHIAANIKLSRRFFNEAQITAQLDHPNIVPIYSLEQEPGQPLAYTMKLIRGDTFAQLIADTARFYEAGQEPDTDHDLATLLGYFVRACDALSYAHSRGVVHRDLKPENIMVGEYNEVYVMDWGISRVMGSPEEVLKETIDLTGIGATKTRVGAVLGTPAYMSPEQAHGENDALDARSDVYSLGLILYELVCLQPAFQGESTGSVLAKVQSGEIAPIAPYTGARVSRELVAVIHKATEFRPQDRYASVPELAADVQRILRGEPVSVLEENLFQRASRLVERHRELVLLGLVFVLLLAGSLTIGSLGSTLYAVQAGSVREARLSQLQAVVANRGHRIDERFLGFQGLLEVVGEAAVRSLSREDDEIDPLAPYYMDASAAPDTQSSMAYGRPVSFRYPTLAVAPDAGESPSVERLAMLGPTFLRTLLRSHDTQFLAISPEQAVQKVRDIPGPIPWMFVGLRDGVSVQYPGHTGVPPGLDARKARWYKAAKGRVDPVWGNVHLDDQGERTLLPLSLSLFDNQGEELGVAALEVDLQYIQESLLTDPDLEGSEAFILDEKGRVLLSTRSKIHPSKSALRTRWLRRKKFESDEVIDAIALQDGGYMQIVGKDGADNLVVWSRMGEIGWTYLVQASRALLMEQ